MDSLDNILKHKNFDEPPEVAAIKKYVQDEFNMTVGVLVRDKDIVIQASSAALANTLRLRTTEIKQRCRTTKRLTFRIG
jgi:phosphoribosylpyrophosphate synthetase